jgi:hypothetical protein
MVPLNRRSRTALGAWDVGGLSVLLALGRVAIGAGLMLAPGRALPALGFTENAESVTIARIAGVRDLVLAASTLLALRDAERLRAASLANAAADGGDALAFALALGGDRGGSAAVRGLPAATAASLSSLWVAWRLR